MPHPAIKNFLSDPTCALCHRPVKGWARAKCDNCGQTVCARHRPLFQNYWQCPNCDARQNQFINTQATITTQSPQGMEVTQRLTSAETELNNIKTAADAQKIIDLLFVELIERND